MLNNPKLNELINRYREKKLAHAYLIETNNEGKALEDIKGIIKYINCNEEYQDDCKKCNLCNLITKNNLPSLKIIEPDGTSIKKNQIEELKESFATVPVYSKYNVYIIKNAEKMNASSANSMLKFLEEPTEGIIGFFITNNKDVMMDTIKSRCQAIVVKYEENQLNDSINITEEEYTKYIKVIKEYLRKINSHEIINHKNELLALYSERKEISNLFQIIFQIYYQNFLKSIKQEYLPEIVDIYKIEEKSSKLIIKLNIITNIIQNLSYNVNIEQALDKFVIEMRESNG